MGNSLDFDGGLTLSVPVSDLAASVAWYQRVLGMELLYQIDELGWCELRSPVANVNLGLSQVEQVNVGETTPTWGVADINQAKATLQSHNVSLDGDIQVVDGMVKLLTFYDPDGNPVMLFEEISNE
ncbi:MAG: VOC family protein [Lysobacterales bacterium]